jgi:hypothetical protein
MAERLEAYVNRSVARPVPTPRSYEEIPAKALQKIYMLLRTKTGHDFSAYKENTIVRRIQKRMDVHQIDGISNYLVYLNQSAKEVKALFKELLIGVTGFFRDSDAFEALKKKALPRLLQETLPNHELRAWIPGCATGEESYTLAMVVQECMDDLGDGQWNLPEMRRLLEQIIPENRFFDGFEVDYQFPKIGPKKMLVNARRIERADETPGSILLAMEDANG